MPRKPRIESNGGLYHVINRGNYRSWIFETDGAKKSFVRSLDEACVRFSWELSAYCLMGNHYHLCVGTPLGNLSEGMRWLQATFASRFNRYRKEHGRLFQGRFKSLVVEPGSHWLDLVDYIHLNPARAGLVDVSTVGRYPWSSLYFFPKRKSRPSYLDCSWMDYFEELEDSGSGWRRYQARLRLKMTDDPDEIEMLDRRMCKGWCLGGLEFRKAISEDFAREPETVRLDREDLAKLNRDRWEDLLERCLKALAMGEADIAGEKPSCAWKLAIARKMRVESSVSNRWLAERLRMGAPKSVSAICGRYAKDRESICEFARKLKKLNVTR